MAGSISGTGAGQVSAWNGEYRYIGQLGKGLSLRDGQEAARLCGRNVVAQLLAATGDLDRVRRIVKLVSLVNSTSDFTEHHLVTNGASELLIEVFGERGAHARSALGVSQIPFGCCVEIEMVVETFVSESACEL